MKTIFYVFEPETGYSTEPSSTTAITVGATHSHIQFAVDKTIAAYVVADDAADGDFTREQIAQISGGPEFLNDLDNPRTLRNV